MLRDDEFPRESAKLGVTSLFQAEHRTMTAFILAVIVNNYNTGQVSVPGRPAPQRSGPRCRAGGSEGLLSQVSDETVTFRGVAGAHQHGGHHGRGGGRTLHSASVRRVT